MKRSICLLLLVFSSWEGNFANGIIVSEKDNSYIPQKNYAGIFQNNIDNNSDKYEIDFGNPDINAKIERPCEVYDSFCIRRFFAEHSKCRISAEQVPEPLFRAQSTITVPSLNLSLTQNNIKYSGLRTGKVEEFYINKATDNLVITLGFDYVSVFSYAHLKYYRRGKEPTITRDYVGYTYGRMSITAVIPNLNDLRLDKAEISTFLHVPYYPFVAFPGLIPKDPELLATFTSAMGSLALNEQEQIFSEGNFYAATFIQHNICDFGLKVL